MGDSLYLPRLADTQPSHRAVSHKSPLTPAPEQPELVNGDEEDYTIRCVCEFNDDDGNTVLCEHCNTWQHIICYYYPRESLDDDFHHSCVICNPRNVDPQRANVLQRKRRDPVVTEDKKVRRNTTKSHKKTKTQTNGDLSRPEGRDGSPRDGAPPAKRPKTSHRHSGSVVSVSGGQRGRAVSMIKRMPSLAELPPDYFSPEFLQANRDHTTFAPAAANLHLNIGITNMLSSWLDDEESFTKDTNGKTHQEVFLRLPQPMEELEVPVEKHTEVRSDVTFYGQHPTWHKLKATHDLSAGDFVGELCGVIGHQADYKAEPANRWETLKHPDQYVFFHPVLPVSIDCRSEGSLLRYVRRSCNPNVRISTLITGAREYRFCFTALQDIPEGSELTVKWDFEPELAVSLNSRQPMNDDIRDRLCSRTETLLSHFGGCACDVPHCLMVHFDRRINEKPEPIDDSNKSVKIGKKRKATKKSPTDSHAPGASRASSEAVTHGDGDDDLDDARSTSQSTKVSRDNTPSAGVSGTGKGLESSERERRKLAQQERLFEQMDAPKRKKRNSGSTSHATPDAMSVRTSTKRPSHPNTPLSTTRPRGVHNTHSYFGINGRPSPDNRSPVSAMGQPRSIPASPQTPIPRPVYCDASTQTNGEDETARVSTPVRQRSFLSLSKRLMRRSVLCSPQPPSIRGESPCSRPASVADGVHNMKLASPTGPVKALLPSKGLEAALDVDMPDAPSAAEPESDDVVMSGMNSDSGVVQCAQRLPSGSEDASSAQPITHTAEFGGSPNNHAPGAQDERPETNHRNDVPLHVNPPALPSLDRALTTGAIEASTLSPTAEGPSPTGSARSSLTSPPLELTVPPTAPVMVRPSPVKKMTLSDYLSKRKGENPALEKTTSPMVEVGDKETVKQEEAS